jgi:hypothetical protein
MYMGRLLQATRRQVPKRRRPGGQIAGDLRTMPEHSGLAAGRLLAPGIAP